AGDFGRYLDTDSQGNSHFGTCHCDSGRAGVDDHAVARDHLPDPPGTWIEVLSSARSVVITTSFRRHFSWDGFLYPCAQRVRRSRAAGPGKPARRDIRWPGGDAFADCDRGLLYL